VRVVLPPALPKVWPALVSQIIIVMLGSAVCGQISTAGAELLRQPDPEPQLPRLRGLHRRHADLPGAVDAAPALNWLGPVDLRPVRFLFGGRRHGRLQPLGHLPQPAAGRALDGAAVADRLRRRRLSSAWRCWSARLAVRGAQAGVAAYVQLFQGTPLLMQLFLAYFGLALLGVNVSAWVAAALALTLYSSAFLTEIWRGCVNAMPKGQWEAAQSLALTSASRCAT
jgi:His/Glu/Gln/Arg/opine family amino acid ABC transporter permease subunit